jgi:hypothetical protein
MKKINFVTGNETAVTPAPSTTNPPANNDNSGGGSDFLTWVSTIGDSWFRRNTPNNVVNNTKEPSPDYTPILIVGVIVVLIIAGTIVIMKK